MDHELKHLSEQIAAAIGRRDVDTLRDVLAPGFVHRSHDGERSDDEAFLSGIAQIPGEIRSVQLESLFIDECPTGALVSGVQRAQLVVNGEVSMTTAASSTGSCGSTARGGSRPRSTSLSEERVIPGSEESAEGLHHLIGNGAGPFRFLQPKVRRNYWATAAVAEPLSARR